jgi:hypothetical protein
MISPVPQMPSVKCWNGLARFLTFIRIKPITILRLGYYLIGQKLARHNKSAPGNYPEPVNFNKPPSYHMMFLSGKYKRRYKKPRDAHRILREKDLLISAKACPELKAFLNRILQLCEGELIP